MALKIAHSVQNSRPSRRRFLKIGAAGVGAASALRHSFSWAQEGSGKGSLRLLFYTDVHARVEWDTPVAMAQAAAVINDLRPDIVMNGGDLITDGFEVSDPSFLEPRWKAYMAMHNAIKGDVYSTIGNHDLVAADPRDGSPPIANPRKPFLDHLGLENTYYSFDALGYHFIVLDSIHVIGGKFHYQGLIWPEQLAWLTEDLAKTPRDTPIILTTHMPLMTGFFSAIRGATTAPPPNRVVVNNRAVLEVFENHRLMLVLQGHVHVRELIRWRDTTFITGGAVCGKWWRGNWYGTDEGFNLITIRDGKIDWEYLDYGWKARRPDGK